MYVPVAEVFTADESITIDDVRSPSPVSYALAPNSTYANPLTMLCGLAPLNVITGAIVSVTLIVLTTCTALFPLESVTS